jgi:hypothetical protein
MTAHRSTQILARVLVGLALTTSTVAFAAPFAKPAISPKLAAVWESEGHTKQTPVLVAVTKTRVLGVPVRDTTVVSVHKTMFGLGPSEYRVTSERNVLGIKLSLNRTNRSKKGVYSDSATAPARVEFMTKRLETGKAQRDITFLTKEPDESALRQLRAQDTIGR